MIMFFELCVLHIHTLVMSGGGIYYLRRYVCMYVHSIHIDVRTLSCTNMTYVYDIYAMEYKHCLVMADKVVPHKTLLLDGGHL